MNCGELLAQYNLVAIVLETFAIHLAFHFGGAFERGFNGAEPRDDVARAFVANAGSTRDIVDGVAFERKKVGNLRRLYAHELFDIGGRRTIRHPSWG